MYKIAVFTLKKIVFVGAPCVIKSSMPKG